MEKPLIEIADQMADRFNDEKSKRLFYRCITFMVIAGIDLLNEKDISDTAKRHINEIGNHNPRIFDVFHEFAGKVVKEEATKSADYGNLSQMMGGSGIHTSFN